VLAPLLLAVALVVVLGGAFLFTNAVEWAGVKLGLGVGAVGSVIAAVATAVPESVIPVIALIVGGEQSQEVAIGAVVGAPFMLATIAMALVGVTALVYEQRRPQRRALRAHRPTLKRDLGFFVTLFATAAALGFGAPAWLRVVAAVMFVAAYAAYGVLTVRGGGEAQAEEDVAPLTFDTTKRDPPRPLTVGLQFVAGLGLIVGGAHLFVEELVHVADSLGVSALVLSLVLAPLATELPEKANSFVWIREGKDALALGNITGAMVFQSTIPIAVGLAFTDWDFGAMTFLACALALLGGGLALVSLHVRARFTRPTILAWAALFATFVVAVIATA
jgi:cation:H+ antiporter